MDRLLPRLRARLWTRWRDGRRLRFPAEDAATSVCVRHTALLFDQRLDTWAFRMRFQPPRLRVQPLQRLQPFLAPEPGVAHGTLEHGDGVVVHLRRHRERMPVLAAVRERE